jgi:hypothetical protein
MIPSNNIPIYETPLLNCWMGEDKILYSKSKSAERSIENYNILFEVYKQISKNGTEKIYTLGDITNTRPMSKEVREYISAELPKYIKAMALISNSPMGKEIGNIFKILQDSPYPIRTFENPEDAKTWLKEIMVNPKENTEEQNRS